jgi:hypothetical protein
MHLVELFIMILVLCCTSNFFSSSSIAITPPALAISTPALYSRLPLSTYFNASSNTTTTPTTSLPTSIPSLHLKKLLTSRPTLFSTSAFRSVRQLDRLPASFLKSEVACHRSEDHRRSSSAVLALQQSRMLKQLQHHQMHMHMNIEFNFQVF